ncbi:DNA alkylation repair protein [Flavobacterium sp. W22_SRS_FP1]|uniref:DNA alkylation repair protein n=1 Tax=Flavobacterium sp. W22_SRS_FP1 TaxID=3240276 RepID=UPI003F8F6EC3
MPFIAQLENTFVEKSDAENAFAMAKYMRNKFDFFGIKTPKRRQLLKEIWKENEQEVATNIRSIATLLFEKTQREFHYCAIEILTKELNKNYKKEDVKLIEKLITTNSWWDTVDGISKNILGQYLTEFPDCTASTVSKFSDADNMWLNRSAILFQLGYKDKTDFGLLKVICIKHKSSSEFFIQKAIGWALREYAKTNPKAVKKFVATNDLKPLSRKEALKNLNYA